MKRNIEREQNDGEEDNGLGKNLETRIRMKDDR
jgi:hypothetical protein